MFPGVCSSYHLHHVAGKVVALAEFEAFGQAYASDIVRNAKAFAESLAAEGFDVLAESRAIQHRIRSSRDMAKPIQERVLSLLVGSRMLGLLRT